MLAAGISDDGKLVKIIDAAPSLSFEAIPEDTVFIQAEDGGFQAIASLDDDPNGRWFIQTDSYGGTEYWIKLSDAAACGLLLIQAK